jgi:hypothetical protein
LRQYFPTYDYILGLIAIYTSATGVTSKRVEINAVMILIRTGHVIERLQSLQPGSTIRSIADLHLGLL